MDFYGFVKRYVWDDNKTPYRTRVDKLTKLQAQKEIFVYALFLAILFALTTVFLSSETKLAGNYKSIGAAFYSFTVMCAAVLFGVTKHALPAMYCVTAPVAAFLHIFLTGLHPNLGTLEKAALLGLCVLWLRYSWRVMGIATAYPHLPGKPEGQ